NKMIRVCFPWFLVAVILFPADRPAQGADIYHAQGEMAGEPGIDSVILQSRLTAVNGLNADRSVPGSPGVARFMVDDGNDGIGTVLTPWLKAEPRNDYIIRHHLRDLKPGRRYRYRLEFGLDENNTRKGPDRWFRTLPGAGSASRLSFLMFNCMSWGAFMDGYGKRKPYAGPDKLLGYPTLVKMQAYDDSHFVIGAGDNVYYDNPASSTAKTPGEMRAKWQQQFSLPRLVQFVGSMGSYWLKDDHDFRYDDADLTGTREPSAALGIRTFREQMPVVPLTDFDRPTYRAVRATAHVQLWLLEGRDYRSPNKMEDGPAKSIWGAEQREWLRRTLVESDAAWKLIITPTPMVGPDYPTGKRDNHTNAGGFRHECMQFFSWLKERGLKNVVILTGDRHWQYHSIHPTGVSEFACGSLHREVAVGNPPVPGKPGPSDPEAPVEQRFVSSTADGGFLRVVVEVNGLLKIEVISQEGVVLYVYNSEPE
ncbi:MAG: alkaline phosphatase D family protein, partial [bacterium]